LIIESKPLAPLSPWTFAALAGVVAIIWEGIVVLAFGAKPDFPPAIVVAVGAGIGALTLYLMPRYSAHPNWRDTHRMGLVFGISVGTNAAAFVGFIWGAARLDLYGKIVLDVIALLLMIWLSIRINSSARATLPTAA
jgi:hypothetical protein